MNKSELASLGVLFLGLLLLIGSLSACSRKAEEATLRREWSGPFDSFSQLLAQGLPEKEFAAAGDYVDQELRRYDRLFNIYQSDPPEGSVAYLNARAGEGPQKIDADLLELLQFSLELEKASGGAFNPCLGPLLSLWHDAREAGNLYPDKARLPDADSLKESAKLCTPAGLILYPETLEAELRDKGRSLDLGAVAKGFALEKIARGLEAKGHVHMLIGIGGSIRALGPKPDGSPWIVGIRNPAGEDLPYADTMPLYSGSLTTSGVYERFFTVGGKQYHHIIDPVSLYPSEYYQSLSVTAKDSALADALSTALFNMNKEVGDTLCASYGAAVLRIMPDNQKDANALWTAARKDGLKID